MKRRSTQGFTLLELLVAIAIFSIMATMAYGGLSSLMSGREHIDQVAKRLSAIQRTFLFLQQDISQIVPRSVRDEFGEIESAVNGGGSDDLVLQLTRGGVDSAWSGRPSLRRVTYQLMAGRLIRSVWPTLDRVQGSVPSRQLLADELKSIELRFFSGDGESRDEWNHNWPPGREKADKHAIPRAIEVKLSIKGVGEITRIFLVGS
ncbi:type II secretion system minor pseudopilin GspJ [Sedimenticola hydrogenitrophicus]|uniref:type II secretion system minor pseudopilin GspJ n=1 Tax=Sedimenticola hydrogenitrophicus TaxID=2967975 RepID=UPI0023B0B26F|nr:type II secretion system minor pseudopilin GspJ [Sedimenticola hydrogenitrophicus]